MLTSLQKGAAQAIVNIFETSRARGDYGSVTLLKGDTGHLTYGRSQTTLASGNLHLLIQAYCVAARGKFRDELSAYLTPLAKRDLELDNDLELRGLLHQAGADPVMQSVQDAFFDRVYWAPAQQRATDVKISSALGTAVVYDSTVHGSWPTMRDRTTQRIGSPDAAGENQWVTEYISVRRDWLAAHSNALLHKTVYRMEAFQALIGQNKWDLPLPLTVRGVVLDQTTLAGELPVVASAADRSERALRLTRPATTGRDVRELQNALVAAGFAVDRDGAFGSDTDTAVRKFQKSKGLKDDGIVGPATRAALGL